MTFTFQMALDSTLSKDEDVTQDKMDEMQSIYQSLDDRDFFEDLGMLPLLNPWVRSVYLGEIDAWEDDDWCLKKNKCWEIIDKAMIRIDFILPSNPSITWEAWFTLPCLEDGIHEDLILADVHSDHSSEPVDDFRLFTNFLEPYKIIKPNHHSFAIPCSEFISKLNFLKTIPQEHWPINVIERGYMNQHYWIGLIGRLIKAEKLMQSGGNWKSVVTQEEAIAWHHVFHAWDPQLKIDKTLAVLLEHKNDARHASKCQ